MAAIKDAFTKAKNFLVGQTAEAQLAEIREKRAAAEAEIKRLDNEISRRARPMLLGDQEATRTVRELNEQKREIEAEVDVLRRGEGACMNAIREVAETQRRAAAAALPVRLAEAVDEALTLDDTIMAHATGLAEAMKRKMHLDEEIARLSGNGTFDRTRQRTAALIRDAIANAFRINMALPHGVAGNNMLGLESSLRGADVTKTLRELDQPRFDDTVPFFKSEAAAIEGQARLAARGSAVVVSHAGEVWQLIRHDELFTDRREADRAVANAERRGVRLVVVEHGPGFRVCPSGLADSAVLGRGEAA